MRFSDVFTPSTTNKVEIGLYLIEFFHNLKQNM